MTDIAKDLRERFDYAVYFFQSAWERDPETVIEGNVIIRDKDQSDFEDCVIDTFQKLTDSLADVTPATIAKAEELRLAVGSEKYEAIVTKAIQNVGYNSFPSTANQFLESLMLSLQFAE